MAITIRFRRGLSNEWTTRNPILNSGEPGYETDSGKLKIGDGRTSWISLPYLIDDTSDGGGSTDDRIGDMDDLTTVIKTTLVESINEINTPPVPLSTLYINAKAG